MTQTMEKLVDSWEDSRYNGPLSWEGSPHDLLQKLNNVARLHKIDTDSRSWPKAA